MNTTSSTSTAAMPTIADIEAAARQMERLGKPTWTLLAPDGRVWQGEPEVLLAVLMPLHPLLAMPSLKELSK